MDVFSLVMRLKEEGAAQVKASVDKLNRSFDEGTRRSKAYDLTIGSLGDQMKSLAGGFALGAVLTKVITETKDAEFAAAQLNAALKSTQGVAGQSAEALNRHAQALAQVSTFDDDAITGAQALLLTFTKVGGEIFPKATQAIVDMAAAMGTDLKSATLQVGKALNDPILGVTALTRAGVQFSEAQREVIAQLVETGKVAQAQTIILKELETQFGGSATAAANTFGGAIDRLANSLGNLLTLSGDNASAATTFLDGITGGVDRLNNALNRMNEEKFGTWASLTTLMRQPSPQQRPDFGMPPEIQAPTTPYESPLGGLFADVQQRKVEIAQLIKLAEVKTLNAEQTKVLRGEAARLTAEMNRQGLSMQGQYEAGKKLLEIQKALAPKGETKKPLKLADLISDIGTAYGTSAGGIPQIPIQVEMVPEVTIPPEVATGATSALAKLQADVLLGWGELMDGMAQEMGNLLVDSIAAAFESLTAAGGSIKTAFQTLTSMLLSGLGDMLVRFGKYAVMTSQLMARLYEAIPTNPYAAVGIGLAMIALGGAIKGAAGRIFTPNSGGGGGSGYSAPAMANANAMTLPNITYAPTAAGSGATIERVNPVSVTIIGPNDPAAQRQMQELLRNAQRRGSV